MRWPLTPALSRNTVGEEGASALRSPSFALAPFARALAQRDGFVGELPQGRYRTTA